MNEHDGVAHNIANEDSTKRANVYEPMYIDEMANNSQQIR